MKFFNNIANTAKGLGRKAMYKTKKHSPEMLVVSGTVGVVVAAVMACKATLKAVDIVSDAKEQLETVHEVSTKEEYADKYTADDKKKDLAIVYARTGLKLAKTYGPAIIVGSLSIGAILGGHHILRKRNAALAAAYATLDKSFKDYRSRVAERFGDEVEHEIKHGVRAVEIEEKTTDENGEEKTVTKTVAVANPELYSPYARWFDETSELYENDHYTNLMTVKQIQSHCNDLIRARYSRETHTPGILYLNEVYDMLGIPRSRAGQVVGWVYDLENPVGDNFVDFGIYDANKPVSKDFVNGYEKKILLDFNVDGNVLEYM